MVNFGFMEHFVTVKPGNELIAKYISYYYFHDSDDADPGRSFVFFPHFKHGFTAYKTENSFITKYTMNYERQMRVELPEPFHKLGVAFHPLGINHFISEPIFKLYNSDTVEFSHWNPEIYPELDEIFQTPDLEQKRDLLDKLFEKRFRQNPDLRIVQQAVTYIFNSFGTIQVDELADKIGVNRKTLLRHFRKHLNCSIEEYKKVVKFRTSIQAAVNLGMKNLTEVSLYSLYYDQSDFTNRFKELTGQTPGNFFASVQKMGEEDIFWKFDE